MSINIVKYLFAIWISLACTIVVGNGRESMLNEYDKNINQIRSYCEAEDLDGIKQTLDNIDKQYAESEQQSYVNLLRAACDNISSCQFENKQIAQSLIEKYATIALTKADDTQIDVQVHFLVFYLRLGVTLISVKKSDFPKQRELSADLWLGVWNKLETLMDKEWILDDPKNDVGPFIPPANELFMPGMRPEDVKDPKVRTEYKEHIKKSIKTTENNQLQTKLREIKAEYSQTFVDYIVNLYSVPPFKNDELLEKLKQFKEIVMKEKIISGISRQP